MTSFSNCNWHDPLRVAEVVNAQHKNDWIFLHSSLVKEGSSRYSIIAFNPAECISGKDFSSLKKNSFRININTKNPHQ